VLKMNFFLRLKHWQLFILMFCIPFAIQIASMAIAATLDLLMMLLAMLLMIALLVAIYCGWFYALGVNLNERLPNTVKMNLKTFKLFLFFPILCIVIYSVFLLGSMEIDRASGRLTYYDSSPRGIIFNDGAPDSTSLSDSFNAILDSINAIFPTLISSLFLFALFCMFYCLNFTAKSLRAVELQRPVVFGDYIIEFIFIWFYPLGVWIIQPRINEIFAEPVKDESV